MQISTGLALQQALTQLQIGQSVIKAEANAQKAIANILDKAVQEGGIVSATRGNTVNKVV